MQTALEHFRETIAAIGRNEAVLKLSKTYPREQVAFLMDQLDGQELAKEKFPSLTNKNIIYPPAYYLEQTSSETTAHFKASIVEGETLVDMTGGFGIDAYFFSKKIPRVWYVEQDPVIFEIAAKNLHLLNPAIKTIHQNSIEFLKDKFDWIYLDPIRRTKDKRLSALEEYSPNIIKEKKLLFSHAHNIMVKLSPMTDISQLVKSFAAKKVYVLAVENECRELLLISDTKNHEQIEVESIHWIKSKQERFTSLLNSTTNIALSAPLTYLYEPNAAIFKAHQYNAHAAKYELLKLNANTHLYTSHKYYSNYEGRVYQIKNILPFNAKSLPASSFNIKTRNFPLTPAEVVKKLGIKDGGEQFLFCIKDHQNKLKLLVCDKII